MGKGRPRKPGSRYPSGQLRRTAREQVEGFVPALVGRAKQFLRLVSDPIAESEIGRMMLAGLLTQSQAGTAFKVGDIYRRYHRLKQLRDHPKSPAWEPSFGSADLAEERMSFEQLDDFEAQVRAATQAWERIDSLLANKVPGLFFPPNVRQAIHDLCVQGIAINSGLYPDVRLALDEIGKRAEKGKPAKADITKVVLPTGGVVPMPPKAGPFEQAISESLKEVLRVAVPDIDDERLLGLLDMFQAFRARALMRLKKRPQ